MEVPESIKNSILQAKNIYLIPSKEPEAQACALALFYTLKELQKNVNLLAEPLSETITFLTPSLDFISYPKNFVISIPNKVADISQIYYEKEDQNLKIFLTLQQGNIKKDNVSFYYAEAKPDLIITLGVKDYTKALQENLNDYGFLLDAPLLNIDSSIGGEQENKKFGTMNIIESNPLPETVFSMVKSMGLNPLKRESATCLLTGIVLATENFRSRLSASVFETAAHLMNQGADIKEIVRQLYH